ncbi:MAG: DUF2800 domain-containing protein [Dechloromonas sp.]|nr:DUF2800 domain-containing protein [Dechloromonas sp.]
MAHARLSPSSAERWMTCPGSVKLAEGIEDKGSSYAAEGTAAHELAERILKGAPAQSLVGEKAENGYEFTQDMLDDVRHYTDVIQSLAERPGSELFVEVKLPINTWTGELNDKGEPAKGTSDAVLVIGDELVVADLKFGMGVAVSAEHNPQLMLYALAAYDIFDLTHGPLHRVRLIVSQPRLRALSEWTLTVEELLAFGEQVKAAAKACDEPDAPLNPSEKGCKFCKAKAICPALQAQVNDTVFGAADISDFDEPEPIHPKSMDEDGLSAAMTRVKMIEDWCKAIRAETERRLLAGTPVPGYKLVQGKMGNRKWSDPEEAEAALKAFRLKTEEMYDLSLISPTTAEKLVSNKTIGPRQWKKLLPLITRSEGQPSVAPESDKRPALVVAADTSDFDVVDTTPEFSPSDFV